jgi:hypothetical protein
MEVAILNEDQYDNSGWGLGRKWIHWFSQEKKKIDFCKGVWYYELELFIVYDALYGLWSEVAEVDESLYF